MLCGIFDDVAEGDAAESQDWDNENGPEKPVGKIRENEKAMVGLLNQGGTCYLNALIQVLFLIPEFRYALYKLDPEKHLEAKTSRERTALLELQGLFAKLEMSIEEAVSTQELTERAFDWGSNEGVMQHDVHELVTKLLERLHSELDGTPLKSLVKDTFIGSAIENNVTCTECKASSGRETPFMTLFVPVSGHASLESSLDAMYCGEPETIGGSNAYKCDSCEKITNKHLSQEILRVPSSCMFVNLSRFTFDMITLRRKKVTSKFTFPETLDMTKYMKAGSRKDGLVYDLVGVIAHSGSGYAGHYISYARVDIFGYDASALASEATDNKQDGWTVVTSKKGKHSDFAQRDRDVREKARSWGVWCKFDDSKVYRVQTHEIMSTFSGRSCAYMLCYRRRVPPKAEEEVATPIPQYWQSIVNAANSQLREAWAVYEQQLNTYDVHTIPFKDVSIDGYFVDLPASDDDSCKDYKRVSIDGRLAVSECLHQLASPRDPHELRFLLVREYHESRGGFFASKWLELSEENPFKDHVGSWSKIFVVVVESIPKACDTILISGDDEPFFVTVLSTSRDGPNGVRKEEVCCGSDESISHFLQRVKSEYQLLPPVKFCTLDDNNVVDELDEVCQLKFREYFPVGATTQLLVQDGTRDSFVSDLISQRARRVQVQVWCDMESCHTYGRYDNILVDPEEVSTVEHLLEISLKTLGCGTADSCKQGKPVLVFESSGDRVCDISSLESGTGLMVITESSKNLDDVVEKAVLDEAVGYSKASRDRTIDIRFRLVQGNRSESLAPSLGGSLGDESCLREVDMTITIAELKQRICDCLKTEHPASEYRLRLTNWAEDPQDLLSERRLALSNNSNALLLDADGGEPDFFEAYARLGGKLGRDELKLREEWAHRTDFGQIEHPVHHITELTIQDCYQDLTDLVHIEHGYAPVEGELGVHVFLWIDSKAQPFARVQVSRDMCGGSENLATQLGCALIATGDGPVVSAGMALLAYEQVHVREFGNFDLPGEIINPKSLATRCRQSPVYPLPVILHASTFDPGPPKEKGKKMKMKNKRLTLWALGPDGVANEVVCLADSVCSVETLRRIAQAACHTSDLEEVFIARHIPAQFVWEILPAKNNKKSPFRNGDVVAVLPKTEQSRELDRGAVEKLFDRDTDREGRRKIEEQQLKKQQERSKKSLQFAGWGSRAREAELRLGGNLSSSSF